MTGGMMQRRIIRVMVLVSMILSTMCTAVLAEPPVPGGGGSTAEDAVPAPADISLQSVAAHTSALSATGRICFYSFWDGEIYAINADGSDLIRLTSNQFPDEHPSWSPDMRRIVFCSKRDGDYEIYTMNADGSDQKQVTFNSAWDLTPSWSPDGKKIVFQSDRDGDTEIFVMNSDGSNVVQLTNNTYYDGMPTWSPDGQYIAFISSPEGADLYRMNANGTGVTRLTYYTTYTDPKDPHWSPDSLTITFWDYNLQYVHTISITGTHPVTLTQGYHPSPVYSPDGQYIAFTRMDDSITLMRSNGSELTKLTNGLNGWPDLSPDWVKSQYWVMLPVVTKDDSPSNPLPIINGHFEFGHIAWTEYSSSSRMIINRVLPPGKTAHSGDWAVWLGGLDSDYSYIQQTVFIPAGFSYLVYYHWIASTDACGFDYGVVFVNGTLVDQYNLCNSTNTGGWAVHAVNLSAYINQTVTLKIVASTDSTQQSTLFVDDVSLQAAAP
jgi:Tol biopolymer transport system component